jgi:hypothetical protein
VAVPRRARGEAWAWDTTRTFASTDATHTAGGRGRSESFPRNSYLRYVPLTHTPMKIGNTFSIRCRALSSMAKRYSRRTLSTADAAVNASKLAPCLSLFFNASRDSNGTKIRLQDSGYNEGLSARCHRRKSYM